MNKNYKVPSLQIQNKIVIRVDLSEQLRKVTGIIRYKRTGYT